MSSADRVGSVVSVCVVAARVTSTVARAAESRTPPACLLVAGLSSGFGSRSESACGEQWLVKRAAAEAVRIKDGHPNDFER